MVKPGSKSSKNTASVPSKRKGRYRPPSVHVDPLTKKNAAQKAADQPTTHVVYGPTGKKRIVKGWKPS